MRVRRGNQDCVEKLQGQSLLPRGASRRRTSADQSNGSGHVVDNVPCGDRTTTLRSQASGDAVQGDGSRGNQCCIIIVKSTVARRRPGQERGCQTAQDITASRGPELGPPFDIDEGTSSGGCRHGARPLEDNDGSQLLGGRSCRAHAVFLGAQARGEPQSGEFTEVGGEDCRRCTIQSQRPFDIAQDAQGIGINDHRTGCCENLSKDRPSRDIPADAWTDGPGGRATH